MYFHTTYPHDGEVIIVVRLVVIWMYEDLFYFVKVSSTIPVSASRSDSEIIRAGGNHAMGSSQNVIFGNDATTANVGRVELQRNLMREFLDISRAAIDDTSIK